MIHVLWFLKLQPQHIIHIIEWCTHNSHHFWTCRLSWHQSCWINIWPCFIESMACLCQITKGVGVFCRGVVCSDCWLPPWHAYFRTFDSLCKCWFTYFEDAKERPWHSLNQHLMKVMSPVFFLFHAVFLYDEVRNQPISCLPHNYYSSTKQSKPHSCTTVWQQPQSLQ